MTKPKKGWQFPAGLVKRVEGLYLNAAAEPGAGVPPSHEVFRQFNETTPDTVRVVVVTPGPNLAPRPEGVLHLGMALTRTVSSASAHAFFWEPYIRDFLEQLKGKGVVFLLRGREPQGFVWQAYGKPWKRVLQGAFELPDGNWAVCDKGRQGLEVIDRQAEVNFVLGVLEKEPVKWTSNT